MLCVFSVSCQVVWWGRGGGIVTLSPCRAGAGLGPGPDLENTCNKGMVKHLWPGLGGEGGAFSSPPSLPLFSIRNWNGGQMEEAP